MNEKSAQVHPCAYTGSVARPASASSLPARVVDGRVPQLLHRLARERGTTAGPRRLARRSQVWISGASDGRMDERDGPSRMEPCSAGPDSRPRHIQGQCFCAWLGSSAGFT